MIMQENQRKTSELLPLNCLIGQWLDRKKVSKLRFEMDALWNYDYSLKKFLNQTKWTSTSRVFWIRPVNVIHMVLPLGKQWLCLLLEGTRYVQVSYWLLVYTLIDAQLGSFQYVIFNKYTHSICLAKNSGWSIPYSFCFCYIGIKTRLWFIKIGLIEISFGLNWNWSVHSSFGLKPFSKIHFKESNLKIATVKFELMDCSSSKFSPLNFELKLSWLE